MAISMTLGENNIGAIIISIAELRNIMITPAYDIKLLVQVHTFQHSVLYFEVALASAMSVN